MGKSKRNSARRAHVDRLANKALEGFDARVRLNEAKEKTLEVRVSDEEQTTRLKLIYEMMMSQTGDKRASMAAAQAMTAMAALKPNANPLDPTIMKEVSARAAMNNKMLDELTDEQFNTVFAEWDWV
jgi:hypothetical protein